MSGNGYLVESVFREVRESKKTGRPYQVLVIVFENGYVYETFLSKEQEFILKDVPVLNK